MRKLLYVISFTSEIEVSKRFYRDILGLEVGTDSPYWVDFATDGVGLALLAVNPGTVKGVELCFEAEDVERSMAALTERGVTFTDELRRLAFGSVIHYRDPENNLLSLLQPSPAASERPQPRQQARGSLAQSASGAGVQTSMVLEQEPTLSTGEARLTAAIIYSMSFPAQREFYKDKLGLSPTVDAVDWVQFETGPLSLALRPRADRIGGQQSGQPVSFGFTVGDLSTWMETARDRGVIFEGPPTEDPMGLMVEAIDPEGNVLTFREAGTEQTLEEHLAEPFEDDDVPHQAAIRKPVKKGNKAVSRVTIKPDYKPTAKKVTTRKKTKAKPKPRFKQKPAVAKARGTGPAGSRVAPKKKRDSKRARARPAIGRLKKAERASATRKKTAVARTSRTKPVKRAVRQTRAGGKRTR